MEHRLSSPFVCTGRRARRVTLLGLCAVLAASRAAHAATPPPATVKVSLSEWKVELTPVRVPPGRVVFEIANAGSIPHAFEVEGRGIEKEIPQLKPGGSTTLQVELRAGHYEVYCPIGKGSHEMLGMKNVLAVGAGSSATTRGRASSAALAHHEEHEMHAMEGKDDEPGPKAMEVTGGGPVIQILPGPFPFADSAMAVIRERPADQQADLTKKAHEGPYSNAVAPIAGTISILAIDRGASGDSVSGTAEFTTHDGARWRVVMDRVQTKDIPFNPRFGGVIMGLFYHGASGVHTPLVPTIQSSLALWAWAHLYRDDRLVTDDAMVHVMLLSRTRRPSDWALDCWDCSSRPIEELQLQVTPPPGTPPFDAPGGFLFVNWEKSTGEKRAL